MYLRYRRGTWKSQGVGPSLRWAVRRTPSYILTEDSNLYSWMKSEVLYTTLPGVIYDLRSDGSNGELRIAGR